MSTRPTSDPVKEALGGSISVRGRKEANRQLTVLTDQLERAANEIIAKYPNSRSATLPLLFLVQAKEGQVTDEGMRDIAQLLGLTPADVLATASFYTMFKKTPQGRYLVSVCRNISCTHMGSRRVVQALQDRLGVEPGGTTDDGMFTLEAAECLATCDGAPSMQVNYEDFYRVTPEEAVDIVERLTRGEEVTAERGAKVRTNREIAYETAVTGAWRPQRADSPPPGAPRTEKSDVPDPAEARVESPAVQAEPESTHVEDLQRASETTEVVPIEEREEKADPVGGLTPPAGLAPGWRPRVTGDEGGETSA